MKRKFNPLIALKFAGIFVIFAFAIGFITMSLWNWLIPALFAGPVITYWQAIGLLILSKILFGGFKGGRGRGCRGRGRWEGNPARAEMFRKRFEERLAKMTPEQQEKMRSRCNFPYTKEDNKE